MTKNFTNSFSRGFTLIELLVSIAIIGILSAIVLAALASARNKGANSSIKSSIASIRTKAQVIYELANPNAYDSLCVAGSDTNVDNILTSVMNNSPATQIDRNLGNAGSATKVTCHANTTQWAVSAPLRQSEGSNNYWCADSSGNSKGHPTFLSNGIVVCP